MNKILFWDIWSCSRCSTDEVFCAVAVVYVPVWELQWNGAPVSGGERNFSTYAFVEQNRTLEGHLARAHSADYKGPK